MTDEEKSQQKDLNKRQHQDRRSKMTDEEKSQQKDFQQKDLSKTQHQGRRQNKKSTQGYPEVVNQQYFGHWMVQRLLDLSVHTEILLVMRRSS
jgi:hypothetical protein